VKKKSLDEVGLPAASQVLRLAYHEPSRTVIAHLRPAKGPSGGKLFFRWATATEYQPVWDCPAGTSVESFALDPSRPALYFLTNTWQDRVDGSWAGNWDALHRFDLAEHRHDELTRYGQLLPARGYAQVWLCGALSVGADGRSLLCTAGLQTPPLADGSSRVEYWVAKLDLKSLTLEAVSELAALWA